MKGSITFREDQKPLFRAKVPLNILGFPFQSGIVAGETKELSLNLSTFFDSGPSLKIAYRPNDPLNPFGFVFKTGIAHFGSPINSPMTMSAEFNLIGNQNPNFFVHFKPQFGDFCIKKSQSSEFAKSISSKSNGVVLSEEDGSVEVIETPGTKYSPENGLFSGKKIAVLQPESPAVGMIGRLLSGTEASARTVLPVMNRAVVSFRWGFRFPPAADSVRRESDSTAAIAIQKLPLLVMNKISIEHVAADDSKDLTKVGPSLGRDTVAETCLAVKRQLEIIQAENGMLRKAMDDLRLEIGGEGVDFGKYREGERGWKNSGGGRGERRSGGGGDKKSSDMGGFGGKVTAEGDANEELKKALMGA